MNSYIPAQLAEIRGQELIADASVDRLARPHRDQTDPRSRNHLRRQIAAFYTWLATAQL